MQIYGFFIEHSGTGAQSFFERRGAVEARMRNRARATEKHTLPMINEPINILNKEGYPMSSLLCLICLIRPEGLLITPRV